MRVELLDSSESCFSCFFAPFSSPQSATARRQKDGLFWDAAYLTHLFQDTPSKLRQNISDSSKQSEKDFTSNVFKLRSSTKKKSCDRETIHSLLDSQKKKTQIGFNPPSCLGCRTFKKKSNSTTDLRKLHSPQREMQRASLARTQTTLILRFTWCW